MSQGKPDRVVIKNDAHISDLGNDASYQSWEILERSVMEGKMMNIYI